MLSRQPLNWPALSVPRCPTQAAISTWQEPTQPHPLSSSPPRLLCRTCAAPPALQLAAAKAENGRIERNLTLTADNLKLWRVTADQGRVPRTKSSGRYVYLSAFLEVRPAGALPPVIPWRRAKRGALQVCCTAGQMLSARV